MILLTLEAIVKHFGPEPVLDGVSCEVRPGDHIGLIGPNGAGKTTLMKIIAGLEEPDGGVCALHPSCRIGLLEQHPEFGPDETVWDVASSGLRAVLQLQDEAQRLAAELADASEPDQHRRLAARYDRLQHELELRGGFNVDHQIARVLHGLGLAESTYRQRVRELSGGQQNRLLLARLLLETPDLMLLDEPSNHLDLESTRWLEQFLAETRQAFIVVSHDRYLLDAVTTRTFELYQGTVEAYAGNFSAYWRQKEERLEVQRRTYERQQETIARTEDFIRRNSAGQKSTQAEDRRKKLERIQRVARPRQIAAPPMGFPKASRTGDVVLRVEGLAKSYDRPLFQDLTFEIERGQRWGLLGPNAAGKTTLLRCTVGEVTPDAGRVQLATGVKLGYLDQLTAGLDFSLSAVDAVRPPGKDMQEPQRRDLLARFGIVGDMAFQTVDSLSGGERNRVGLARLAAIDANFIVLDEPTHHLDLWARDALEKALLEFDGTLFLVSHDRYFLNRVVDHLLVVEPGRFRVVEGNYEAYRQMEESRRSEASRRPATPSTSSAGKSNKPAEPASGKSAPAADKPKEKRKRKFPYRKVGDLEADILGHETEIEELHAAMADPDVHRDGRIKELAQRLETVQGELAALYEHWEEAVELN